jgi:hypothetical protein
MTDIKPGYMLQIDTWENDGDNDNTIILTGLNKDEVEFYIRVASLFNSNQGFGNTYNKDEEIAKEIDSIVEEFKNSNKSIPVDWLGDEYYEDEYYEDCLNDLIGRWNEGEYWRVFDNFKVYDVPVVIKDITKEFESL